MDFERTKLPWVRIASYSLVANALIMYRNKECTGDLY